jgi:hypothetical protein
MEKMQGFLRAHISGYRCNEKHAPENGNSELGRKTSRVPQEEGQSRPGTWIEGLFGCVRPIVGLAARAFLSIEVKK